MAVKEILTAFVLSSLTFWCSKFREKVENLVRPKRQFERRLPLRERSEPYGEQAAAFCSNQRFCHRPLFWNHTKTKELNWTASYFRGTNLLSRRNTLLHTIYYQGWTAPWDCTRLRLQEFLNNRHMKVARLPALRTGRLYPPGDIRGTHFCLRLSRLQGHSAAGRIMSVKNPNDAIGNRTPTYHRVPWSVQY